MRSPDAKLEHQGPSYLLRRAELVPDEDGNIITMVRCSNPRVCGVARHEYKIPVTYYTKPCYSCGNEDHCMLATVRETRGMIFTCPISNLKTGEWDLEDGCIKCAEGTHFIVPDLLAKYYKYDVQEIQDALNRFAAKGMGRYLGENALLYFELQTRHVARNSDYDEIPDADDRQAYLGQEFWSRIEGGTPSHTPCQYCGSIHHSGMTDTPIDGGYGIVCSLKDKISDNEITPRDFAEYYNCDATETNQCLKNYRFWGEGRNLTKEEEFKFSQEAMEACFDNLRRLTLEGTCEEEPQKEDTQVQL